MTGLHNMNLVNWKIFPFFKTPTEYAKPITPLNASYSNAFRSFVHEDSKSAIPQNVQNRIASRCTELLHLIVGVLYIFPCQRKRGDLRLTEANTTRP